MMTDGFPRASLAVPPATDFVSHLRWLAEAHGEVSALHFLDDPQRGEVTVTYAELHRRARAIAARLRQSAKPGDRVCLLLDTGLDYVAGFFGCLQAGLIAVPVFPPEPRRAQHQARIAAIIDDAEPALILVHRDDADSVHAMLATAGIRSAVLPVEDISADESGDAEPAGRLEAAPLPEDVAFLQYTSGSTAVPKGVVVSHANLVANERLIRVGFDFRPDDVMVSWLPLYHDMGLIGGMLQPIYAGILGVLMSPKHFLGRPARWLEAIHHHRGTVSGGPDFAFRLCQDRVDDETVARLDLSSWQIAFSGSEMVRASTMADFAQRFAPAGFDARALRPSYGLAEATLFLTAGTRGEGMRSLDLDPATLAEGRAVAAADGTRLVDCGFEQPGHPIHIAGSDGESLPDGTIGEVVVSGPSLAQGYWRNPDATAAAFVERHGVRCLRTGDLGFLHRGRLFLVGREKDLIILRGQNVYPQDVERVVEQGVDILRRGRIAAFAIERDGREGIGVAVEVSRTVQKLAAPEAIASLVSEAVADAFLETARVVVLLNPGGLPRTSSGKIQRGATRRGWETGALDAYAVVEGGRRIDAESAPESGETMALAGLDARLAAIWSVILDRRDLTRDSHFFALGGNSIAAIGMLTELRAAIGIAIPPQTLFAHPRLGAFADAVGAEIATGTTALVIAPAPRDGALPLSLAQERLWFEAEFGDDERHHIAGGIHLHGALDRSALDRSLAALVARHEAFRTRLHRRPDGRAEQVIVAGCEVALPETDLTGFDAHEREERFAALCREAAERPFTLAGGPLARFALVRLGGAHHVLLVTLHHIVSDGWSMGVILREWPALYRAEAEGLPTGLPPLTIQPADIAAWQASEPRADAMESDLAWWRERLGGPEPDLSLSDRQRRVGIPDRVLRHGFTIGEGVSRRVAALAGETGTSPFTVLLGAFALFLHRYGDTRSLRIAMPVAGRHLPGVEHLVGVFVNTLVLPVSIDPASPGRNVISQLWTLLTDALAHQDLPFERLVEALQPERIPGRAPLARVMISQQPATLGDLGTVAGLKLEAFGQDTGTPAYDFVLEVSEKDGGLSATFAYSKVLFDPATIARFEEGYRALLDGLTGTPAHRIDTLELVPASSLASLSSPYADGMPLSDSLVPALIGAAAQADPDAPAVICGPRITTFGELDRAANRLAHRLIRVGIGPETVVAVALPRGPDQIAAFLAILRAGGAFLPLDPAQPRARLSALLRDAGARLLLVQGPALDGLAQESGMGEAGSLDPSRIDLLSEPGTAPSRTAHPEQLAYVIYTSGSTGTPKGVAVAHGPLARHVRATGAVYGTNRETRELHVLSMSFDGAQERWMVPLAFGGCVVLKPDGLWTPREALDAMERHGVTHAGFPTAYMHQLAIEAASGPRPSRRSYAFGGEALSRESFALIGRALDPTLLINGYGPTETVISPLVWRARAGDAVEGAYAPIGRAVGDRRAYILDAALQPVPVGVTGELHLGGDGLARGYLGRAGQTADRFIPDPFPDLSGRDGGRLYRTGDLARWRADGTVEYLGRADAQVKLRGFRIELGEVEAALLAQETVAGAAAALRQGPAGPLLMAYVVNAAGADFDAAALRADLARRLPDYMVPSRIVALDRLPLTPNGKLDRAALPEPAPLVEATGGPSRPLTATETVVAEIWAKALGLPAIPPDRNFFEAGGDSILSLQIVARLREAGFAVTPRQIFEHQTVTALARVIARPDGAETTVSVPEGPAPLTPIQHWFFEQPMARRDHWNQSLELDARVRLDADRLGDALAALVAHHEALRYAFGRDATGAWIQEPVSAEMLAKPLSIVEVESDDEARVCFLAAERSLNLADGRVFAAILANFPDGRQRLLLTAHHLVVDAVSWRILVSDLDLLYRGDASAPAVATPFRAWAYRLRDHAAEIAGRSEAWASAPSAARLPVDRPEGARDQHHAATRTLVLDPSLMAGLDRLRTAYGMRLDEVLLAGLSRAVAAWSGHSTLGVTLERHGRDGDATNLPLDRTVGWFTTLVPITLSVSGDVGRDAKSTKEAVRTLPGDSSGYSVLRYLGPESLRAKLSAQPWPEVTFNHLGTVAEIDAGALFSIDAGSMRLSADPAAPLGAELIVDSFLRDGAVTLRLGYSAARFDGATIDRLAERLGAAFSALAEHGLDPMAGGATPSDFPLAALTQDRIDGLDLRDVTDIYPLTPTQGGILFHALAAPEAGLYVNQLGVTIRNLDPDRFAAAWRAGVARHPILRTSFLWTGDLAAPLQLVHASAELPITRLDLSDRADADLDALARAERARGFDLAQAPLMRLLLVDLGQDRHRLIWTCHHLLLDGWSNARLISEVLRHYAGEVVEAPTRLFREHLTRLSQGDRGADEAFWREALAGLDEPSLLAPALSGETGASGHIAIDTALGEARTDRLQAFARRETVTLNTVFEAAWALTLSRFTGRSTVAFGTTGSGRPPDDGGMHGVLGLFINTVPRCVGLPGHLNVGDWLRRLQGEAAALREHDLASLADIQAWVGRGGQPLFDSLLVVENYPLDAVVRDRSLGGLEFGPVATLEATDVPLTLSLLLDGAPRLNWSIDQARISSAEVRRLNAQVLHILDALMDAADTPLDALTLVPPDEIEAARHRAAVLRPSPAEPAIHLRIAWQAGRRPQAVAVTCEGEQATYADLETRAARLARRLVREGVRPGDLVGLCAERSISLVVGILAILKSGAGYVPLDPAYPADRLAFMLADCGARHVLATAGLVDSLPEGGPSPILMDGPAASEDRGTPLPPAPHPDQPAYVIYTSGSTGRPKGVVVTHANAARLLTTTQEDFAFAEDDVWTLFHSYGFDFSVWETFGALCHGGRLVVVPREVARAADAFLDLLVREGVTVLNQTPSAFRPLMQAALARPRGLALRHVVFGGEALDVSALRPWFERFGDASPRLVNMYGITETTVHVTYRPLVADDANRADSPIGEALPDLTLHLLDAALDPVPDGVAGELHVGGAGLAQGYLGRAALTAERFVPDPFGPPGARLYRSGDLAVRRPDGTLAYLGRADGQVKLRGFRIETGEIAAALRAEPGVIDAAVILRDAAGDRHLVAYVVGEGIDADALRSGIVRRLPAHMVPAHILVVASLPLTPNGKLDLRALPAPLATSRGSDTPEGAMEIALAEIWREILDVENVGRDDDFFALGGHSLTAAQLAMRVKQRLGLTVPIRALFEAPTLRGYALAATSSEGAGDGRDEAADLSDMDALLADLEA
ncbi:non-ribosomal peptide synthetase [Methylobacterium sp. 88A]|uniref:non-ribosomal peptide synthetase n=1 Tax=Methylobacterium sp. 88A TaxID=1131813 RepID=UPI00037E37AC|nr:non-ribosomal peptide synthetase [Methylobacterium sp. 88A]